MRIAGVGLRINLGWRIGRVPAKHVRQLSQGGPDVDETQAGDRAARVVAGQHGIQCRRPFHEVIAFPERRPWNQDEQQACFEQQGDEKEPPEQSSASSLDFGQAFDLDRDIAIAARLGLELDEDGQRA